MAIGRADPGQAGAQSHAETRLFGPTGLRFSPIGLGTWEMEKEERAAVDALRRGIAEGANHIDTAEMYGNGEVERIVGKAVRGIRDRIHIVSKVLPSNASYPKTIEACERSLRNLGTDTIDVYLLHWRGRESLRETFRAFDRLLRDGKIRAFGVSNFDVSDMKEAVRVAGPGRIACNQVLYHLKERAIEFGLLSWCLDRGIAVVAYSPLGQGRLVSDPTLAEIARARSVMPAQVALSFLIRRKGVFAIPKSSHAARTAYNVRAGALELAEEDMRLLERSFPPRRRRSLPML